MPLPQYWQLESPSANFFADAWAFRHACGLQKLHAFEAELAKRRNKGADLWGALDAVTGETARKKFWRQANELAAVRSLGKKSHGLVISKCDWTGRVTAEQCLELKDWDPANGSFFSPMVLDFSVIW